MALVGVGGVQRLDSPALLGRCAVTRWKKKTCGRCRGYGVIDAGYLEVNPQDCPDCNYGTYYVSEKDATAEYPGGRFLGKAPGLFAELEAAGIPDAKWPPWADELRAERAQNEL